MKKLFLLSLFVAPAMLFAAVTQTVLFENDFNSYVPGNFYGQDADYQIMTSDIYCVGQEPVDGEVTIVYDEERASNVLYVKKIKAPEGLSSSDAKKDRGLRVPLDWGSIDYANGENAFILVTGKVKVPEGNGYAELRLANTADQWMMRFSPYGGDSGYKTYFYNYNDSRAINAGAANANEPRFQTVEGRTSYTSGAVKYDTWCDFTIVIDCELGVVRSFEITDNDTFNFASDYATILKHFLAAPAFFEFTAVGNGYDTNRMGAYFDDLKVTFVQEESIPWVTVFEDDFSTYNVGDSLTEVNPIYKRIGNEVTYTDLIENDGVSNYAKIWINTPSGYPFDGILYDIPAECVAADGTKLRFTAITKVPDNGVWAGFYCNGTPECTLGYHSANAWFTTWSEGAYTDPRYSGRERNIHGAYYTGCRLTIATEGEDTYLESTRITTDQSGYTDDQWGCPWSEYYVTSLAEVPTQAGITVQGWDGFNGRYTCLRYFKVEYAAPEPSMIALLALFGLAFLRRK